MKAIDYLLNIPTKKIQFGLERTYDLLNMCGNPEKKLTSFQILGTNGKGSVSAFLSQILQDQNYKVGLYTSPHLVDFNERIRINNKTISNEDIEKFIQFYYKDIETIKPSFFEIMTTISVWYFHNNSVDFSIMETGLGGRLDSVTACKNKYLVFTPISKDHQNILGKTLKSIATEKAGAIIQKNQICFSTKQQPIVQKILLNKTQGRKIYFSSNYYNKKQYNHNNSLLGNHQKENSELAKLVITTLKNKKKITIKGNINKSIQKTYWPARFQIISNNPMIVYDVAHNNAGIKSFIQTFDKFSKNYNYKYLICAFEYNKNIATSLNQLSTLFNVIICTETKIRHSMPAKKIKKYIKESKKTKCIIDARKALTTTLNKANKNDAIAILGTHFFAPHINNIFKNCFAIDK